MSELSGESEASGLPTGDLFEVLTDALRAGPGSPEWAAAVLRIGNGAGAAEYRLLLSARQRLEAGKSFRSIESTPQLTHAVLASVSAEAARPWFSPARQLSARAQVVMIAAAAVVILTVAGLMAQWMVMQSRPGTYLYIPKAHATQPGLMSFESLIPDGWKPIGSLRVKAERGLRLAGGPKQIDQSGGLVWQAVLSASKPFKVVASVRYLNGASVSPEIFVSDDADFDDDRPAERNHEFVWTMLSDTPQVRMADRTLALAGETVEPGKETTLGVQIEMSGATATVATSCGKHCTHWTGTHLLATDKAWRMGVRFVVHGSRHDDCVAVESIRLAMK